MNKSYGTANTKTGEITVNKSMNRNGLEYLDTVLHENSHINYPNLSEKQIIEKTQKLRQSIISII